MMAFNVWDTVKTEFLETYEPKYSAKTTCANFTDLNQKSDESINDYIHTFSTMSSLKSSKHTYSQHFGIRHQLKPFRGFTDENKKPKLSSSFKRDQSHNKLK